VAELIRGLGEKAPGSWGAYQEITSLKPGNERATASEMLKDLLQDQGALEGILQEALKVAQNAGDEVISDFIVGRLAAHRKVAWMLKSSL
jgi:starvation-inducible DNA-binding protein